jgi:hypothetical protein
MWDCEWSKQCLMNLREKFPGLTDDFSNINKLFLEGVSTLSVRMWT